MRLPSTGNNSGDRCGVAEARRGEHKVVALAFAGSNPVSHPRAVDGVHMNIWSFIAGVIVGGLSMRFHLWINYGK